MNRTHVPRNTLLLASSFSLISLTVGCLDSSASTPEIAEGEATHGATYPLADMADTDETGRIPTPLPARMADGRILCRYERLENEFGATIYRPVTFRFDRLEQALARDPDLAAQAGTRSVRNCEDAERISTIRRRQLQTLQGESPEAPAMDTSHDKILNGVPVWGAGPGHNKWGIMALRYSDFPESTFCSATFISDRHLLTAAHCFGSSGSTGIVIYSLDHGATAAFADIIVHPDYNEGEWSTDIAVVRLWSPDPWATPSRRFRLYTGSTTVGKGLKIYGYGVADQAGSGVGTLRAGKDFASIRIDRHSSGYFKAIGHTARACQGDSGGPAIDEDSGSMAIWGVYIRGTHDPHCTSSGGDQIWTKTSTSMTALIRPATGHPCPVTNNVAQCW
jgi:Trypsin